MDKILIIDSLHAWYDSSHILHGIDLFINRGSVLGVMGHNGMGKTTLVRTIMGLTAKKKGKIFFQDKEITDFPSQKIARIGIGYAPEGRQIFPNLTVRENLIMAAKKGYYDLPKILTIFPRLNEKLQNFGSHLSGGEQQMLSIARAIMTNPQLLILDEATEGLAPIITEEIWQCLYQLSRQEISVLIIDRNYQRILDYSQRIIILEKGKIICELDKFQYPSHLGEIHEMLGL